MGKGRDRDWCYYEDDEPWIADGSEGYTSVTETKGPLETKPPDSGSAVDHPKHYNSHPSGIEAIEICRHMDFNLGNVVKYLFRAGHKDTMLEDLKKAQFYINDEIKRLEHEENTTD